MAAAKTCGNCHQPMGGNHFYRKIGGQNKRFCKKDAIQKGIAAGHQPNGNVSFPLGGAPATAGPAATQPASPSPLQRSAPAPAPGPAPTQRPAPAPQPSAPTSSSNITRPQLESWLKDIDVAPDQYEVVNGRLNIKTSVHIVDQEYTQLPLPFGKVDGDFEIIMQTLKTFKNFPTEVKGDLLVMHTEVETCDDLDIKVGGSVYLSTNNKLKNFRKVHKHIRSVGAEVKVDLDHKSDGGLGLLLISGIQKLRVLDNMKVDDIMDTHFSKDADLLDIQEELIDAGFKNIARI
jgi:hypothetical protein